MFTELGPDHPVRRGTAPRVFDLLDGLQALDEGFVVVGRRPVDRRRCDVELVDGTLRGRNRRVPEGVLTLVDSFAKSSDGGIVVVEARLAKTLQAVVQVCGFCE